MIKGADTLTKKKPAQYIVEREFLCKFSVEELLIRIVKSHIKNAYQEGKTFENHGRSRTLLYDIIIGTAVE